VRPDRLDERSAERRAPARDRERGVARRERAVVHVDRRRRADLRRQRGLLRVGPAGRAQLRQAASQGGVGLASAESIRTMLLFWSTSDDIRSEASTSPPRPVFARRRSAEAMPKASDIAHM
jgi:hypothetical protein